jgi:hypothetical protein
LNIIDDTPIPLVDPADLPRPVAVLANGWEPIAELLRHVPHDLWAGRLKMEYPNDYIWL